MIHPVVFLAGAILILVAAFPYLVYLIGIMFGRKQANAPTPRDYPPISIVISAYNEEKNIKARVENLADCNYPNVEVIFVDDCSSDQTLELARKFLGIYFNHHIIASNVRRGTSASYNLAIANVRTDIVVVTDADTIFRSDAIHRVVARLVSDEKIGAVTGDLQSIRSGGIVEALESRYRSIYGDMCEWESAYDSTFNFNGALMAFRKSAVGVIEAQKGADDTNIAFAAIRNGYRAVYEKGAVVMESIPQSFNVQYRQKVRRASGLLQAALGNTDLLYSNRMFARFYFLRLWMLVVSPWAFFAGWSLAVIGDSFFLITVFLLILPICLTFVVNQAYLMAGMLARKDIRTWESTSSLEGKV